MICPNCKTENSAHNFACGHCGKKLPFYQGPENPKPHEGTWVIELNRYHRDNLILVFNLIGYGSQGLWPFSVLNNGDWVGEIPLKLMTPKGEYGSYTIGEEDSPNRSREYIKEQIITTICVKLAALELGDEFRNDQIQKYLVDYREKAIKFLNIRASEYTEKY